MRVLYVSYDGALDPLGATQVVPYLIYRSLTEFIDTATPVGRAMFYILNVFAELEREMIAERTRAGLDAARRGGKILGRRCKLSAHQISWAREALQKPDQTNEGIARMLCVSSRTLRRSLASFAPEGSSCRG